MSLARCQDGVDTDLSAEDFVVPTSNTPGETNPECVPVECTVGSGTIKINELLSNPSGTDSGNEWIELYNAGSESQRLDDWIVETATKEWSEAYVFEGGVELAAGEFLLLGAEYVPGDYVASSLSLGNGGTAPDGVRLVDCEAVVQDTVLWGDDDAEVEDSLEDDLGDSSMGVAPEEDLSLGRYPDGEDSDDNAEDLYTNMTPTPGYENVTGSSSNVDDSAPQKGCGKSADGDGPSKCASVSAAIHLGWLAGLVVLARRRDGD